MNVLHGRIELIRFEIHEERARLGKILGRGLLAALAIFLSVQLIVALAIALAWDTPWRLPVIVGLVVACLVVTFTAVRSYRAIDDSKLFVDTARSLAEDQQQIKEARQ